MPTDDRIARIWGDRAPLREVARRPGGWTSTSPPGSADVKRLIDVDPALRGRDLAGWSAGHGREIAAIASEFGQDLDPSPKARLVVDRARRWMSERSARSSEMELVMVRDLRECLLEHQAHRQLGDDRAGGPGHRAPTPTCSHSRRSAKQRRNVKPRGRTRTRRLVDHRHWSREQQGAPSSGRRRQPWQGLRCRADLLADGEVRPRVADTPDTESPPSASALPRPATCGSCHHSSVPRER